jgi:Homeodomain-like domain
MNGAILSAEDRAQLLQMMRRQTLSTVHRRMNALLLVDDGWSAEGVAAVLFIDAETVREHRRLYQKAGVAGVLELKYEGDSRVSSGTARRGRGIFDLWTACQGCKTAHGPDPKHPRNVLSGRSVVPGQLRIRKEIWPPGSAAAGAVVTAPIQMWMG